MNKGMVDEDTRDYYFDLLRSASPQALSGILVGMYGWLEGIAYVDSEPLLDLMHRIQLYTDIDHGVE